MWNRNGNSMMRMTSMMMRYFSSSSRKRAPNLRKINPRVPFQEAAAIAEGLYGVVKSHGPLSIGNAWNLAKMHSFLFLPKDWSCNFEVFSFFIVIFFFSRSELFYKIAGPVMTVGSHGIMIYKSYSLVIQTISAGPGVYHEFNIRGPQVLPQSSIPQKINWCPFGRLVAVSPSDQHSLKDGKVKLDRKRLMC
ncbi:UNVERIFIED_CONTAM: hypothetical protein Sradi_1861100 [Sesamum radiatum]|uniref:Uncharacterized protein n=1 Tax=Sesamum radiatum TaxID=300843 RepID=A0AAW2TY91_SESRA